MSQDSSGMDAVTDKTVKVKWGKPCTVSEKQTERKNVNKLTASRKFAISYIVHML